MLRALTADQKYCVLLPSIYACDIASPVMFAPWRSQNSLRIIVAKPRSQGPLSSYLEKVQREDPGNEVATEITHIPEGKRPVPCIKPRAEALAS